MGDPIVQAVVDAAVALCLAEKRLFELTDRGGLQAQMAYANQAAGLFGVRDWVCGFAGKISELQTAARKATAEVELLTCRSKLATAVREYQSPPQKV